MSENVIERRSIPRLCTPALLQQQLHSFWGHVRDWQTQKTETGIVKPENFTSEEKNEEELPGSDSVDDRHGMDVFVGRLCSQ